MPSRIASKSTVSHLLVQTSPRGSDVGWETLLNRAPRSSITISWTIEGVVLPMVIPRKLRSNLRRGIGFDSRLVQIEGKCTSSTCMPGDFS